MYNCLSCVVQQASFTPVSVGWWILCRSCHCLYSSQTCLALSGHGGRQGETKCMFMIALHQLFLFLVINRHCPCTCIFIRAAAGLVSLICQNSEMLQFDFTLLSFLPVFILAGVLCKLHAHHGQYLAPRKVRTTQEGLCFRDGLRAWSPPLWPCAKKTKRCIQWCWVFFFCRLLQMMMWIASHCVYVLWQSVFPSWRTSSLWSVAIPCLPCWTPTRGERKRKWTRYVLSMLPSLVSVGRTREKLLTTLNKKSIQIQRELTNDVESARKFINSCQLFVFVWPRL